MLEKLIYSKNQKLFQAELSAGEVPEDAIAFIDNINKVWHRGKFYGGQDNTDSAVSTDKIEALLTKYKF